jgi:uncharacterized repeat protein (TIGR01451 family)/MYXO-CTERM domain-containing protein
MRRSAWLLGLTAASATGALASPAAAVPTLRQQVNQHGDFVWIGNTSAHECSSPRAPVVGTQGACGSSTGDSAPDVFWRADSPGVGQAEANTSISAANARSTAILSLPAGATVTYARIYWAAQLATNSPDTSITIDREAGFSEPITADQTYSVPHPTSGGTFWYEGTAEITSTVVANSVGAYRVSGIDSVALNNQNTENPFVGWSIVVFYELASEPTRNLALFDGLDLVSNNNPASATLSGFLVPNAGFDAKLGVLAYEGDTAYTGDSLVFNGTALTDAVNPLTNFFNGSRSRLGSAVSVVGDLPQLDGLGASMSGLDLDIIDVTSLVAAGQTSATIQATSSGDTYMIGAFATSISTYRPDYGGTTKTFTDLNGGGVFRDDIIEYTIVAPNTGNDTAVGVVLTDPLPTGIVYIPGSIQVTAGANVGAKTDGTGDDQGEYNATTRTITVRLGTGANATTGGTMTSGESTTITFRARVDTDGPTLIANQATVTAGGQKGNPTTGYPTGNGSTPGTPTDTPVDECTVNTDCPAPKPLCYTTPNPNACVVCIADSDCGTVTSGRVCTTPAQTCGDGCRGVGGNGCPVGLQCSSATTAIGICLLPDGGVPPLDAGLDVFSDGSDGSGDSADNDGSTDAAGGDANDDGATDGAGGAGGADSGRDASNDIAGDLGGASGSAGTDGGRDGDGDRGGAGGSAGTDGGRDALNDQSGDDRGGAGGAAGTGGLAGSGGAAGDSGSGGDSGASGDGGTAGDDTTGGAAGAVALPDGRIEGGGCACTTPGSPSSSATGTTTLLVALAALTGTVRRKRRR